MKNTFTLLALVAILFSFGSCKDKTVVSGEITSVTVTSFPMADFNGETWDLNLIDAGHPDLELKFNRGGTISNDPLNAVERYDDVTSPGNYTFDDFGSDAWELDVLTDDYTIAIYDYDIIGSDAMAAFSFSPTSYTDKTPSSFVLETGNASITVTVNWTFEE
jgi:hypothetical protein